MHQGKHQEYEKRLHDALIAQMQQQSQQPLTTGSSNPATESPVSTAGSNSNGSVGSGSSGSNNSSSNGISKSNNGENVAKDQSASGGNNGQIQKEAWPSLSTSPVTIKENTKMKGSKCAHYYLRM